MSQGPEGAWTQFDAVLAPLAWGRNVYVVIELPPELVERAQHEATHRLEGFVDAEPVNVGVVRADVVPGAFFYAGKPLRRRLGSRPGDVVRCRLRPVDPDVVPVPDDVREALAASGAEIAMSVLPPPTRRRLLMPIEAAATDSTRAARIDALVRQLR